MIVDASWRSESPAVSEASSTNVFDKHMEELFGVWREAARADKISGHLSRIRNILGAEFFESITAVLREVESSSRLLRDIHDLFPIYKSRVSIVLYYLQVILPCYCRTLRDMMIYLDNPALEPRTQWTLMNERLNDQGGMNLAARFGMYIDFLVQLIRLLSRSPLYDPTNLEILRIRLLRLRLLRNIPPPQVAVQPHHAPLQASQQDIERRHWAEKLFDEQPHSTTGLKHRRDSKCFGPPMIEAQLGLDSGSTVLFKLSFDKNHLSVTLYLHPEGADVTRLLCRWMDRFVNPLYSCHGIHELLIKRKGSCLQLKRWSENREHSVIWLALFFKTWEKMVLFYATFVAMKCRCPLTLAVHPDEYRLGGERKLFQGQILDDGFRHSLYVYQDEKCHGTRLHAAVWEGELKRCPVWTAFVTYQFKSSSWLQRRSRHRVWVKDIRPYVFCQNYRVKNQLKKSGEFELEFVNEKAADAFTDVFASVSESDRSSTKVKGKKGPATITLGTAK